MPSTYCPLHHWQSNIKSYMIWVIEVKLSQFPAFPIRCTRPPWNRPAHCFHHCIDFSSRLPNTPDVFSTILPQFLLGPPLLHLPWGLQLKTHSSTAKESFLSECPIHFHFPAFICIATGSSRTLSYCSSMGIMWEQKMLIFVKRLFVNQAVENYCEVNQETVQDLRMGNINVFIAG